MKFLVLGCLALASIGVSLPFSESSIESYIVGGKNTSIIEVPYQVAMYRWGYFACGGTIVSPTHIVTAAHCVRRQAVECISFRAGSSNVKSGGVVVKAKAIYIHPSFNYTTFDFDVAVVELDTPLQFSNITKPLKLASSEPKEGFQVRVSGWGLLKENGVLPPTLQSVVVPVVNRKNCSISYEKYFSITPRMLCAGVEGKDSCQGDSGGPLEINGQLAGVVSFGIGCARKGIPGVYTNVADSEINSFIQKYIKS